MSNLAAQVHDRAPEFTVGQVNPDQMPSIIYDTQQDGSLAPRGRPVANLLHQTLLNQVCYDTGDGGAGQTRMTRHIRPADPAMIIDGLEDQLAVVSFSLLVSRLLQQRLHRAYIYSESGFFPS